MSRETATRMGIEPISKETKRTSGELASQSWRFAARSFVGHDTVHPQPFPHDTPICRPNRHQVASLPMPLSRASSVRFLVLFRFELPRHEMVRRAGLQPAQPCGGAFTAPWAHRCPMPPHVVPSCGIEPQAFRHVRLLCHELAREMVRAAGIEPGDFPLIRRALCH